MSKLTQHRVNACDCVLALRSSVTGRGGEGCRRRRGAWRRKASLGNVQTCFTSLHHHHRLQWESIESDQITGTAVRWDMAAIGYVLFVKIKARRVKGQQTKRKGEWGTGREEGRERKLDRKRQRERVCVCVSMHVCVWKKETEEREIERELIEAYSTTSDCHLTSEEGAGLGGSEGVVAGGHPHEERVFMGVLQAEGLQVRCCLGHLRVETERHCFL